MPKLLIDGREIEVPAGSTVMQALEKAGVKVPYYCWHPGLSIAGNCRMCLVEVEKAPKPMIACDTKVAEGMVVKTQSEMAKKARAGTLEFILANHPLDCPVCDQAGECELQNFYMNYGLYDSKFDDEKVKKHKAEIIGPTVMLDSERCILCSRCVRFCDEITHTGELGIMNRGDHEEIGIYPGKELDNKYSGNVVDICPVGALTDRDFRFKCRVWYLTPSDSVCPGCSMGCNIRIDSNLSRPHHAKGERVMRLKPRENQEVNKWWMCDEGRYGYKFIDHDRIVKAKSGGVDVEFDQAVSELAAFLNVAIKSGSQSKIGVLVSTHLSNEDLYAIRKLFKEKLGIENIDYRAGQKTGYSDDFLMKADKSPNTAGARALEMNSPAAGKFIEKCEGLILFGVDLPSLPKNLRFLAYIGTNNNSASKAASIVIPGAVYAEKEGTFTNFEGRVQRFREAFAPLGDAKPEWQIACDLSAKLGIKPALSAGGLEFQSAEAVFREIAKTVPPFEGLSYESLGNTGKQLKQPVTSRS